MRTLFEDTDERADREDDQDTRRLPVYLWTLAIIFLVGASGLYYWATHRKPPVKPPVAVSIDDPAQVTEALNRFGNFVKAGKWDEAQQMLSSEALRRLEGEKKSLRESLLGNRKDDKVVEVLSTPSGSRTQRVDCALSLADGEQKLIPLSIVIEDSTLLNQTLQQFGDLMKAGKWDEAQQMLSSEDLKRLQKEKQTFRESVLGKRKDAKVANATVTASNSPAASAMTKDYAYLFADNEQRIIALSVVKENDRLVINNWSS